MSRARRFRLGAALVLSATALAGCNPSLPDSGSAAAKLYETRCAGCHRLYPPNVMTAATWEIILDRMQGEMRRRGVVPLNSDEMTLLRDYLRKHALTAG